MTAAAGSLKVGDVEVGGRDLFLIAGPCDIESQSHGLKMDEALRDIAGRFGIPYIFKASYDKANRTSIKGHRGPGLEEGLRILGLVGREAGVPVLTDVHEPGQVPAAAEVAEILQIPAFLSRQTDLISEAARSGRAVNIKKGQFLAPDDMRNAADKVLAQGNTSIILTERGASFGYHNLAPR